MPLFYMLLSVECLLNIIYYFFYTDDVTVEYALWNEQSNAYTDIKQKAVYRQTDSSVLRYLSYEWDEKNNDWSLTADHHMTDESVQLLAEK